MNWWQKVLAWVLPKAAEWGVKKIASKEKPDAK